MISRYKVLVSYSLRHWRELVLIISMTVLSSTLTVLGPWPLKILVDYALGSESLPTLIQTGITTLSLSPTPSVLIFIAAFASLGLFALNNALSLVLSWAWASLGQRAVYDLAADMFNHLQHVSILFHRKNTIGDFLNRLSGDVYCVYSVISKLLITPGKEVLTLVIIGGVTWTFDPLLTAITMVVALFMSCITVFFSPRFKRLSRQGREAESRLMSFVHQTLTAIPIVQAFGTEDQNLQQFDDLAEDVVATSQRGSLLSNTYSILNGLVTTIGTSFIIFVVGQRVLLGTLSIGSFLLFLAYMRTQLGGFRSLLNTYSDLKKTEARIDRVFEVLEEEEEVPDDPNALSLPISTTGINGHIRLENVTFGYEVNRPVLKDITLEAHPDETVALVGPTGAGKSTLVSLIPRFFDPWEGQVLFDDIDMRKIKLASLRAQISLVLQEPFLLPLSVAENISYGRPEATREEIVEAAVAAGADGFIQQLSQGYDTVIGERGATLSGGEKQRLSIARALLKDAPILILDEPTSALDAKTEADLLAALGRLMAGRTTFIIAHRLSTIRNADRIVVLDNGSIVEEGTHQELINKQGLYNKFYDMQFGSSKEHVVDLI